MSSEGLPLVAVHPTALSIEYLGPGATLPTSVAMPDCGCMKQLPKASRRKVACVFYRALTRAPMMLDFSNV